MARHCLRCSYRLDYLAEPRCPECGQPFDPQNLTTFTSRAFRPAPDRILGAGIILFALLLTLLLWAPLILLLLFV